MIKIELGTYKVPCPFCGDKVEAVLTHEDARGFRHVVRVCSGCLDHAIDSYRLKNVCEDCRTPVPRDQGFEINGKLVPLCYRCQGKRITQSTMAERLHDAGKAETAEEALDALSDVFSLGAMSEVGTFDEYAEKMRGKQDEGSADPSTGRGGEADSRDSTESS